MQVLPATHMPARMPSPTLTNPDLILPFEHLSSEETSRVKMKDPQLPSPIADDERYSRSGSIDHKPRLKPANQSLSPFRNGILAQNDAQVMRSNSERGHGRIKVENSRLSYRPNGGSPTTSSPTAQANVNDLRMDRFSESPEEDDHPLHNTYKTPSILDEDEEDPESHAAMTRRAEEILANAKKRLTNMEGNLNRARSTLGSRPSSSMSSFADRETPSQHHMQRERRAHGGYSPLKHRQANPSLKDDAQGHLRISSETSVPSSLHTTAAKGRAGDATGTERNAEPARFWNGGVGRSMSLAERHKRGLQPLNENGPAPDSFDGQVIQEEEEEDSEKARSPLNRQTFGTPDSPPQISPTSGLNRSRSITQMRDLREQMSDLKGKISTLKQRAREDSLRRRSLQTLRTPSPLTNADVDYSGVQRAEEQTRGTGLGIVGVPQPEAGSRVPEVDDRVDRPSTAPEATVAVDAKGMEDRMEVDSGVGIADQPSHLERSQPGEQMVSEAKRDIEQSQEDRHTRYLPDYTQNDRHIPPGSAIPKQEIVEAPKLVDEPIDLANSPPEPDDFQEAVGERHEDRADAFDYEHFFLHSSMGHYGRKRSSTHSSNYSTETERPPTMVLDDSIAERDESPGKHMRQNSSDSVSTAATFATATEDQSKKEADLKKERSKKKHRREHSVTENGVAAPSEDAPELFKYLNAVVSRDTGGSITELTLNESDRELAERVIKSLAKVCRDLHEFGPDRAKYEARVCRRKLDTARRHLDGEVNGEAF
ncbi:uncharacterized protein KY384_002045 [Bacidia gigantensis]|uniref:uncharacterized protein n=1 Tax=Bacidia gigantensis TaxID=2732470 RepID=UPI001D048345|nr:uncharacterized protein KY384_002045 [Bacidia gigantensis]KAG8533262.1 hypothetical protein KY384_002045 [Bacidia gigantensis]